MVRSDDLHRFELFQSAISFRHDAIVRVFTDL